jgi:hypothetical protein
MMSWIKTSGVGQLLLVMVVLLGAGSPAYARKKHGPAPFKYDGGTEKIPRSCEGLVEVGSNALIFKYSTGSVTVPYSSIKFMQYRPNISKKIQKLKINWEVVPQVAMPLWGSHKNRYFAIVYEENGATRAIVLEVPPETMRPYLAEIDLKAGKRVEVQETEEYE